jgi:hypothetical protein
MKRLPITLTALLLASLGSACGVTYKIHAPTPSSLRYVGTPAAQRLSVVDQRPHDLEFSDGRVSVDFEFDGFQGEHRELEYLQQAVESELAVRGIPVSGGAQAQPITVQVRDFGVRNRRVTGWSPMVTYTRFSADFTRGSQTVRVAAYSKQVKMPVWGMGELEEPCFNRPLHLVAGELAAKLNQLFVGARVDAAQLAALKSRAETATGDALLRVVNELGWSNHPDALVPLVQLAKSESEEVRGAALGAIGTLGSTESFGPLQQIYQAAQTDTDRYLALKAIGDLANTLPEALAFLNQVHVSPGDHESDIVEITKLYLDARPVGQAPALASAHAKRHASASR